ncbi:MAG: ABC transporter transmembrane domain-containing protein, partial [Acidimicrobiia bacterium]
MLFLTLLASIGLQLVVPLLLRRFLDASLAGTTVSSLVSIGIAYLIAGLINQVLSAGATYIGADLGWRATNELRHDLAEHLIGLDMSYHTGTTPGEMIERIDGDVTAVSNFIARFVVRLAGSGLLLLGVLVVSTVENLLLGLGIGLYVIAVLVLLTRMRSYAVAAAEEEREASAILYGFIEERVAGIEDIRANGGGEYTMFRFVDVMRDFYTRTVAAWRRRTVFWISANTAFWTGDALALAGGVWLHQRGTITVGTAYLILQYMQLVRTPIEQVAQEMQELQKAAGGIIRIDTVRNITTRLDESGTLMVADGPLSLEFADVSFRYDDRPVLTDVSFHLAPGTVLGLLGRTGGGKTTITRLISRLYDPDTGRVLLGGLDIRTLAPNELRKVVGSVTQDVQLFAAPVRDNLTFFDRTIDDGELLATLD